MFFLFNSLYLFKNLNIKCSVDLDSPMPTAYLYREGIGTDTRVQYSPPTDTISISMYMTLLFVLQ